MKDIIGSMPVIGTINETLSEVRDSLTREFQKEYLKRYPSISAEDLQDVVNHRVDEYMEASFDIDEDVVAISVSANDGTVVENKFNGLLLNVHGQNATVQSINKKLSYREQIGHAPKGCDSIQYVAFHELAHQFDEILKINEDTDIHKYFEKFCNCGADKQKELLCTYASTDVYEFVAEAYAEAMTSANPRKIAIYVKQKFDSAAKEYRKTDDEYVQELEKSR